MRDLCIIADALDAMVVAEIGVMAVVIILSIGLVVAIVVADEIGQRETIDNVVEANGISIKLSALHPRYQYAQKNRVMGEMLPRIRELAFNARQFGLGFTIDAEEAHSIFVRHSKELLNT